MSAERCPCCGCLLADHLFGREMETPGCKSCMCLNDPSNSQWHHTLAPDIQATVDRCRERAAQAQGRKPQ